MNRSAPETGYGFGNKRQYRREIWANFRRACVVRSDKHALLMPSIEGDEIEVAMKNGFKQQHLHVVDKNPAIVAHLKRRYPLINTYGVDLNKALQRINKIKQPIHVMNLDFCSNLSENLMTSLVFAGNLLSSPGIVAINILRGRELNNAFSSIRGLGAVTKVTYTLLGETDRGRAGLLLAAIQAGTNDLVYIYTGPKIYRSTAGSQTMMWLILSKHPLTCPCNKCDEYDNGLHSTGRVTPEHPEVLWLRRQIERLQ